MGAKIEGRDTSILTIEGVEKLHAAKIAVVPDRIEAGSYAIAAAITKGRIELINAQAEHLQQPLRTLEKWELVLKQQKIPSLLMAETRPFPAKIFTQTTIRGFQRIYKHNLWL